MKSSMISYDTIYHRSPLVDRSPRHVVVVASAARAWAIHYVLYLARRPTNRLVVGSVRRRVVSRSRPASSRARLLPRVQKLLALPVRGEVHPHFQAVHAPRDPRSQHRPRRGRIGPAARARAVELADVLIQRPDPRRVRARDDARVHGERRAVVLDAPAARRGVVGFEPGKTGREDGGDHSTRDSNRRRQTLAPRSRLEARSHLPRTRTECSCSASARSRTSARVCTTPCAIIPPAGGGRATRSDDARTNARRGAFLMGTIFHLLSSTRQAAAAGVALSIPSASTSSSREVSVSVSVSVSAAASSSSSRRLSVASDARRSPARSRRARLRPSP